MHTRVDKTAELMLSWMVAHAEALELLAAKLDRIARSPAVAELHDDVAPRLKLLWPTSSNHDPSAPLLNLARSNEMPPSHAPTLDPATKPPSSLRWPKVDEVLARCGIELDEDYLIIAENRPALQLLNESKRDICPEFVEETTKINPTFVSRKPRLDRSTIKSLYLGFAQHILPLQPFLPHRQIKPLLERFIRLYSENQPEETSDQDERCVGHVKALKRKHEEEPVSERARKRSKIECSPNNAIVFLVLALGETALSSEAPLHASGSVHTGIGHELADAYPGVAYYAKAMGLMAGHLDGDDLVHAQMFLLAGLYKAQLGRIQEASSWYFMAGRVLLRLLDRHHLTAEQDFSSRRSSSARSQSECEGGANALTTREQLTVLSAWACLRFESESTPELRFPLSGLEIIKNDLPLPEPLHVESCTNDRFSHLGNISHVAGLEAARLQSLSSFADQQIFSGCSASLWPEQLRVVMKSHTAAIHEWRMSLPELLRWNDQDPPPNCCSTASFRRSYWEAKIALLKPFLYYALHILPDLRNNNHHLPPEVDQKYRVGYSAHILAAIHVTMKKSGESEILRNAELCLDAVKHSIVGYDGIVGKVVLTNVPGATHRYVVHLSHCICVLLSACSLFTNVLLLTAAHCDASLRRLVSGSELRRLMDKTIQFTQRFTQTSPTCVADSSMLRQISRTLF